MIGFDFWLELIVLLACLFYAAPRGGMTLGLMGGVGLIIFIFGFGLKPGKPPVDVILTIMAVVCAGATMQAAGGLDCLLSIAEKALRKHPRFVCYLAPYLCWFLTVLCGTGHVVYTMLPIIYDVAIKNNIRPERPMAASTIAAQMGVICSPAAVAAVSMIAGMHSRGYGCCLVRLGEDSYVGVSHASEPERIDMGGYPDPGDGYLFVRPYDGCRGVGLEVSMDLSASRLRHVLPMSRGPSASSLNPS